MKRKSIYNIIAVLFLVSVFSVSCTKKNSDVRLTPQLSTSQLLNVTSDSATVVGFVVAQGSGFDTKGVCYNTAAHPTIDNNKVAYTGENSTATFKVVLSGLHYATTYYARAYAIDANGAIYGEEYFFTTLPVVPMLTTDTVSSITGNSATGGGNVTGSGGADVTARGVCYGSDPHPTISSNKTSDGKGTGAFVSSLTSLKGNTTYYYRAYATNSAGTGYGPELSFTTMVDLPQVTTSSVDSVTKISAVSGGIFTYDGGGQITERGLVWGMNANPTINDNKIVDNGTDSTFVTNLTGLTKNTTYHVRAYVVNSAGVGYGNDIQFTTLGDSRTWYIPGDYVEASYPGSTYSNWSPGSSPQIKSTVNAPDALEGYVYMANSTNKWKVSTQADWNGTNYGDDNNTGVLDPNASNNIASSAGYYKINVDAATLKYTAVATIWGVIGDATPDGWNDETPLAYDPTTDMWRGGVHMTAGSFKFRANHSWDYNYGSDNNDGTLQAGGANIPDTVESDYAITLDLSHPNAYTYSANRWGLIGDATPDGWNSDQNMTWDATNKVFSVTLDLVAGSIKFRANDGWDINYGGDLNALTAGGANIAIAVAGNYTVTFDPWGLKATVTKN